MSDQDPDEFAAGVIWTGLDRLPGGIHDHQTPAGKSYRHSHAGYDQHHIHDRETSRDDVTLYRWTLADLDNVIDREATEAEIPDVVKALDNSELSDVFWDAVHMVIKEV